MKNFLNLFIFAIIFLSFVNKSVLAMKEEDSIISPPFNIKFTLNVEYENKEDSFSVIPEKKYFAINQKTNKCLDFFYLPTTYKFESATVDACFKRKFNYKSNTYKVPKVSIDTQEDLHFYFQVYKSLTWNGHLGQEHCYTQCTIPAKKLRSTIKECNNVNLTFIVPRNAKSFSKMGIQWNVNGMDLDGYDPFVEKKRW